MLQSRRETTHAVLGPSLDPRDEVLVPDPSYVNYAARMVLADAVAVPVPTTAEREFRLAVDDIARLITARTKGIVLGFPSNPTGTVLTREDLNHIGAVALRAQEDHIVFNARP